MSEKTKEMYFCKDCVYCEDLLGKKLCNAVGNCNAPKLKVTDEPIDCDYYCENKHFILHKLDMEIEDTETEEFHPISKCDFDYTIMEKINNLSDKNKELDKKNKYFLKLIFAAKNHIEMGNFEKIDDIVNKITEEVMEKNTFKRL